MTVARVVLFPLHIKHQQEILEDFFTLYMLSDILMLA